MTNPFFRTLMEMKLIPNKYSKKKLIIKHKVAFCTAVIRRTELSYQSRFQLRQHMSCTSGCSKVPAHIMALFSLRLWRRRSRNTVASQYAMWVMRCEASTLVRSFVKARRGRHDAVCLRPQFDFRRRETVSHLKARLSLKRSLHLPARWPLSHRTAQPESAQLKCST